MIVYLWDAAGSAFTALGVTDDQSRARQAAEACIRDGQAASARVEQAQLVSGIRALNPGYARLGQGWTAQPGRNGRVRWVPLADASEQAAS
jgi:hypothetical protein